MRMAIRLVPRLNVGDLICLNRKGVEWFGNQLHFFNTDYPLSRTETKELNLSLRGVVVEVRRERREGVQYQKEPLAVVAWCTTPPITTHIKGRWLKKVYHH